MSLSTQNNIVTNKESNELFPVFLKLHNFRTLLVGAGNVGLEKLEAMLNNSPKANITVVGDRVSLEIKELLKHHQQVQIFERKFEEHDLTGVELVILATDDKALHHYIRGIAKEKGLLVNVADTPDLCDFYLGSIVKKGNLKIAISTNGKSPTVAKRIKQIINESLPDEIDETLDQMSKLRDTLKGDFAYKVRKMNKATSILLEDDSKIKKWSTNNIIVYTIVAILAIIGFFNIVNYIVNLFSA